MFEKCGGYYKQCLQTCLVIDTLKECKIQILIQHYVDISKINLLLILSYYPMEIRNVKIDFEFCQLFVNTCLFLHKKTAAKGLSPQLFSP